MTLLKQDHFRLYDELVVLYLLNAELFDMDISKTSVWHRYNRGYNTEALREVFADMITGAYVRDHNIVFSSFPEQPGQFTYDVRQIMVEAIALYGHEEWKANVMTDEFHGHLGVFSIVGAKMGTKAKEIFGVGNDQLDVITYAGQKPPYSCLTDGIQVSTGATMGMGTIHLAADSITAPMALFTYKGKTIRMTLKPEYLQQVDNDINEGLVKFGLADDGYWKLVRRNALRYWLEWDRNQLFIIEEIK
jgi:pyrimidine-specific ribonucleoside hydrolase